ncbi:MAG TPA: alpha/beta family hydrolase, partial [Pyrinomonadaceae bacterium]|nr:alpha/beta family hydrolase [Pyrinomonadaceae bacterium]
TGTHDEARGEQDDARTALDYLAAQYPGLPLTLAGFSFGARVGLEYGTGEPRIRNLIGIGTPVNMYDFGFLDGCRKPILFVHGERDEFGDIARLRALSRRLPPEARARLEIIPEAGHFFDQQLDEMQRVIRRWMEETLDAG